MTREEGIALVNKYQIKEAKTVKLFLDWVGMAEKEFYDTKVELVKV